MTHDEADEIMHEYLRWRDVSCSCHINPPCSKCVGTPSDEDYNEAKKILEAPDAKG